MFRILTISYLSAMLALAGACGKDDDKSKQDTSDKQANAEPAVTPASVAVPKAKPVEKAPEEPALSKKKASEIDAFAMMDILKAAGWGNASSGGMTMGAWSQTTITAKQGDKTAKVTVVSPSGAADDPKSSVKVQTPAEQLAGLQEKGAAELLQDDFLVGVVIDGDPEAAAQLLAHIKQWIMVEK